MSPPVKQWEQDGGWYEDAKGDYRTNTATGGGGGKQQQGNVFHPEFSKEELAELFSVKVDAIGAETTEADVYEVFSRYGEVRDIYIPKESDGYTNKPFCFVRYGLEEEAQRSLTVHDVRLPGGRTDVRVHLSTRHPVDKGPRPRSAMPQQQPEQMPPPPPPPQQQQQPQAHYSRRPPVKLDMSPTARMAQQKSYDDSPGHHARETNDPARPELFSLKVDCLAADTAPAELVNIFSIYGVVREVYIPEGAYYGFVRFGKESEALAALAANQTIVLRGASHPMRVELSVHNNKQLFKPLERRMYTAPSQPQQEQQQQWRNWRLDPPRVEDLTPTDKEARDKLISVKVDGIEDATNHRQEVYEMFSEFGKVREVYVPIGRSYNPPKYMFVRYATLEEGEASLSLNGRTVGGWPIRCSIAKKLTSSSATHGALPPPSASTASGSWSRRPPVPTSSDGWTEQEQRRGWRVSVPARATKTEHSRDESGYSGGHYSWKDHRESASYSQQRPKRQVLSAQERERMFSVKVNNVGWDITEDEIEDVFSEFGYITEVYHPKDKPFAFVRYASEEEAMNSLSANGVRYLHGQPVACEFSRRGPADPEAAVLVEDPIGNEPYHPSIGDPFETITIVDGIGLNATQSELLDIFGRYGEVADIYIPKDNRPGFGTGYCFVRYPDIRMAEAALEVDNRVTLPGRPGPIHCSLAAKRQMHNSREEQEPAGSQWEYSSRTPEWQVSSGHRSFPSRNDVRAEPYSQTPRGRWESSSNPIYTDTRHVRREAPLPSDLPAPPGFERYMTDNFQQQPRDREDYIYERYSHYRPSYPLPASARPLPVAREAVFDDRVPRQPQLYSNRTEESRLSDSRGAVGVAPTTPAKPGSYYARYSHYRPGPKSFEKYMGEGVRV
ncbi:hypothetical protein FOL47_008771 [Perkinsus chesapeaki]|uniref:RRM domain-containing protein n=1 Tax=Perkinsus chesapeaki TaxID=330153 RepID=A0A7J6MUZ0_PERCH|nr:hypothetical protein FOL47_008771 [Perkinsus chesapeaki]